MQYAHQDDIGNRAHQRVEVEADAWVRVASGTGELAEIVDASPDGMGFFTRLRIEPGSTVTIVAGQTVLRAVAVHLNRTVDNRYHVGIRLLETASV